jgi:bifunctional UDP-N-acetylglucosamine pyrophosphorylase/glucosamine-1-phosphate N-acetyltransferase
VTRAAAVVLAAGEGKRMRSGVRKVLHRAGGRPLLFHVLDALASLELTGGRVVVVPPGAGVEAELESAGAADVKVVVQQDAAGTADALRRAMEALGEGIDVVLVAQGGSPLITTRTFRAMLDEHARRRVPVTLLTAVRDDPFGYGRVIRDEHGEVAAIVEERDATEEQRLVGEVNAGAYVFDAPGLLDLLDRVGRDNDQREYYLPDVVSLTRSQGRTVATHTADASEILGVKSRVHLAEVEAILRRRTCERWMLEGVTIVDPATTYIDATVTLSPDAVIHPFTFLEGATSIAERAHVGPQARIVDSQIGAGATASFAVVIGSSIGPEAIVGPFASLRPGTRLGPRAKVGTFVETKNTSLGEGSKAPHLSYLGDAEIGREVNVGAGTITCNYDGVAKHRTVIEDGAYISSDTMLVAPVTIGEEAATGAGAVVREDVPPGALAVGVPARNIAGKGRRGRRRRDGGDARG